MAASRQHDQLLLPAIHISSSPVPSPSCKRHCDDPDCFIWTRTSQAERWAAFDSFHPSEIDEDYGALAVSPRSNLSKAASSSWASSDSEDDFLHSLKERRIRRAAELKTRAKARLMPPFDHFTRQTRRSHHRVAGGHTSDLFPTTPERVASAPRTLSSLSSIPSTPIRDRRLTYRTPSPPPLSAARGRAASPSTPRTPRIPTTPMLMTPTLTPASTVAHRSPIPTPHLPMCLNSPSP